MSVSLQFPQENCPFPLTFHAKTIGKFRYFLLCLVQISIYDFRKVSIENQHDSETNFDKKVLNEILQVHFIFCCILFDFYKFAKV